MVICFSGFGFLLSAFAIRFRRCKETPTRNYCYFSMRCEDCFKRKRSRDWLKQTGAPFFIVPLYNSCTSYLPPPTLSYIKYRLRESQSGGCATPMTKIFSVKRNDTKLHTLPLREPLFGLAWLLLLICMFLPQGGQGGTYGTFIETGLPLLIAGIPLGFSIITLTILPALLNPMVMFSSPMPLVVSIFLSDSLFILSPIILIRSLSAPEKMNKGWLIYTSLCIICMIAFGLTILTTPLVAHIDPGNGEIQLLPGFIVWAIAQVTLTIAAALKS